MVGSMSYKNTDIAKTADVLKERLEGLENRASILRAPELRALFDGMKLLKPEQRAQYGKELNQLKSELSKLAQDSSDGEESLKPIDVTAPFDINTPHNKKPKVLPSTQGSIHPLMSELQTVLDIFARMGFDAIESRQIDDDYHMFETLNFPEDHPAKDDYDTFTTVEKDKKGKPFVAPAHTSTMQNRILKHYAGNLKYGQPIAVVIPGRVFRNEDLDARHEHTFYQLEGIYVDKGVNVGHLIATLKTFLQEYYGQELEVKTQPFYFPFTEPSFEFTLSCPFCQKKGCQVCSQSGWIELLGCGLIHPEVLKMAGIDPKIYTGFAWGGGIDRLVMMKYGIEDIRHLESGKLEFLRQFS